jgi:NitT/TauT family transport system permease protein
VSVPTSESAILSNRPGPGGRHVPARWNGRDAAVFLAPAGVALAALICHRFLPNLQLRPNNPEPLTTQVYPRLLEMALAGSLVLALAAWLWSLPGRWLLANGPLLAGGFFLFLAWDMVTLKLALLPLPYFPGPDMVFESMIEDSRVLAISLFFTFARLAAGYGAGVAAGILTGVVIGWFRMARYWGMPLVKLIGPTPATAFIPLALVLIISSFARVASLIALSVWFPVTMLTISGIANVPVSYLNVARTLGAGRLYLIFRVALPSAMPSIFLGLFMGLSASFLVLMAVETVGVSEGIGWYINMRRGYMDYENVYAALLIMAVFFSGLMTLFFKVRDRVLGWQKGMIRW